MAKKLRYAFTLYLVLMILSPIQLYSGTPEPQIENKAQHPEILKMLTWNIYMLPYCSWIHGNCKRARVIAKRLSETDYDIIVFEEAFDFRARNVLRRNLKEKYPFMYGPANETFFSLRTNSGVWILSKIPLLKLKEIEYKLRYGIDAMARKGAVLFEGEWQGQTFQLAATHLQADSPDSVRREQCHEIATKLLNIYSRANVPQIVCGDFNIEMDDAENYHYMLTALDVQNGLLDGDILTTFDEVDNNLAKVENGKRRLIDYVLVRNNKLLNVIRRRVAVFKEYKNNLSFDLSDHYGMEASINFGTGAGLAALPYLKDK
jgi:endonuclease/exonuclease/phosphatase family metal-dependent hydrolase